MAHCNHCIQNDQPLKYMVESMTKDRKLNSAHLESIDTATELRSKPTNLNYYNRNQTMLFGTAPFMGKGHSHVVDIETNLRDGKKMFECNSHLTETPFDTNDHGFLHEQMKDDSIFRPISTRADLRNTYAQKPCNKK